MKPQEASLSLYRPPALAVRGRVQQELPPGGWTGSGGPVLAPQGPRKGVSPDPKKKGMSGMREPPVANFSEAGGFGGAVCVLTRGAEELGTTGPQLPFNSLEQNEKNPREPQVGAFGVQVPPRALCALRESGGWKQRAMVPLLLRCARCSCGPRGTHGDRVHWSHPSVASASVASVASVASASVASDLAAASAASCERSR
jgi:hypothetical protein